MSDLLEDLPFRSVGRRISVGGAAAVELEASAELPGTIIDVDAHRLTIDFGNRLWGRLSMKRLPTDRNHLLVVGDTIVVVVDRLRVDDALNAMTKIPVERLHHLSVDPLVPVWDSYCTVLWNTTMPTRIHNILVCNADALTAIFLLDPHDARSRPKSKVIVHVAEQSQALRLFGNRRSSSDASGVLDAFLEGSQSGRRAVAEREAISDAGMWVRHLRRERMTQKSLAAKAGTPAPSLSLIERGLGERGPTIALVARILFALGKQLRLRVGDADRPTVMISAVPFEPPFAAGGRPLDVLDTFLAASESGARALAEREAITEVGRFIRNLRGDGGTQEEISTAAGTTTSSLSLIERGLGERGPTIGLLARIFYALGFPLNFEVDTA